MRWHHHGALNRPRRGVPDGTYSHGPTGTGRQRQRAEPTSYESQKDRGHALLAFWGGLVEGLSLPRSIILSKPFWKVKSGRKFPVPPCGSVRGKRDGVVSATMTGRMSATRSGLRTTMVPSAASSDPSVSPTSHPLPVCAPAALQGSIGPPHGGVCVLPHSCPELPVDLLVRTLCRHDLPGLKRIRIDELDLEREGGRDPPAEDGDPEMSPENAQEGRKTGGEEEMGDEADGEGVESQDDDEAVTVESMAPAASAMSASPAVAAPTVAAEC